MVDEGVVKACSQIAAAQRTMPVVKAFFDQETATISYAVHDAATRIGVVINSVLDYDPASGRTSTKSADDILAYLTDEGIAVQWLLETHAHADHLTAAPYLQQKLSAKIAVGEHIVAVQETFGKLFHAGSDFRCDGSEFDTLFADGAHFRIGNLDVTVLHVPGHTPACVAYVIGDAVFVGDTMFMPDFGTARADFPGADARTLFRSLRRILELPPTTRLFMCHDYLPERRTEHRWESTVEAQRKHNIHAHDGISEDEFVKMREARDQTLPMPRLILPSIQVNMRAGHFPAPEANGVSYLKMPLNAV